MNLEPLTVNCLGKKGTLILTSVLEDLVAPFSRWWVSETLSRLQASEVSWVVGLLDAGKLAMLGEQPLGTVLCFDIFPWRTSKGHNMNVSTLRGLKPNSMVLRQLLAWSCDTSSNRLLLPHSCGDSQRLPARIPHSELLYR